MNREGDIIIGRTNPNLPTGFAMISGNSDPMSMWWYGLLKVIPPMDIWPEDSVIWLSEVDFARFDRFCADRGEQRPEAISDDD